MELLTLDDVHLTYPPRFRHEGSGGEVESDTGDGMELEGEVGVPDLPERDSPAAERATPVTALRGVSLTVSANEAVGLLGPVGSGRTTLLALINGVLRPDRGTIRIRGHACTLSAAGAGFFGDLTVRDNIVRNAVLMGMSHQRATQLAPEVAEFAGVPELLDQTLRDVSRSHTKRIGYATALFADPTVLLGDEELVMGPPELREAGLARLEAFRDDSHALVVVTNRADQLKRLCTRGVVLDNGTIAFDGSVEDALRHYRRAHRGGKPHGRRGSDGADGDGESPGGGPEDGRPDAQDPSAG